MNDRVSDGAVGMPEFTELEAVLGREVALRLSPYPGGWRTLSLTELEGLGLSASTRAKVQSLQRLAQSRAPRLAFGALACAESVGVIYRQRIGELDHEVVLALALDGRNHIMQELELARGGKYGAALVPSDLFRPLLRAGASSAILIHNHPSGDPSPSPEDIAMTRAVAAVGEIVGIPIVDHVIVTRERWSSLLDLGVFDHVQENES